MPSFDDVQQVKGLGSFPGQGPTSPYWVLKGSVDLSTLSTSGSDTADLITLDDAFRPFVITHAFMRAEVTTFDGSTPNLNLSLGYTSFFGALISMSARGTETRDSEEAAHLTSLLKWWLTHRIDEMMDEGELSAQYFLTYGLSVLHPTWVRELRLKRRTFKLEDLAVFASQFPPGDPMAALPGLILDPATEQAAADTIRELAAQFVRHHFEQELGDEADELFEDWSLTPARARRLVRSLREEGMGEVPLPYVCKNEPRICALKPFREVFWQTTLTDITAGRIYQLEWLTEQQLETRARSHGWRQPFIDQAKKLKGRFSDWQSDTTSPHAPSIERLDSEWRFTTREEQGSELIEVCHAYYWQNDEDGVPQLTHTVFSAHQDDTGRREEPLYARHEPLAYDHDEMPFVVGTQERWSRRLIDSRGYPEILATRQREVKVQRDALIDWTSISVLPPINEYDTGLGTKYEYGPMAHNTVTPGREPMMMEIKGPGVPSAFHLYELVTTEIDNDLGRLSEKVHPSRQQTKKQKLVNRFLRMWSRALNQQFALMQQFMTDTEYQRITGSKSPLPKGEAIRKAYDVQLVFDVRTLDMEHVLATFKAIAEGVAPFDKGGVIDWDRAINLFVRALNPTLADEIVTDKRGATERVRREVQEDLVLMFTGNPSRPLLDDDPTAAARLQFAQEAIAQNPKYQQGLQADPDFASRVQDYVKNLQFAMQQSENKITGRTGVAQPAPQIGGNGAY